MEGLRGLNCGVFVGVASGGSADTRGHEMTGMEETSVYDATSSTPSIAAGRISYVFDLEGPNSVYDTACSSSLVALHAAVSSLRQRECKVALVVAVNQLFDASVFAAFAKAGMLSPSGHCHTWDASANGYLRGEGCGAIVLEAFDESSSADVYANILGTSVMSDGKSASITAPNGLAQERVIRQALKVSNIRTDEVDYIEAHGTGTALGDPIEMEALAGVFAASMNDSSSTSSRSLLVGSVKSNIGHLEMAAGMAGLIKAILVVCQESVPPNVGLEKLNPRVEESIASHDFSVELPTVLSALRETSGKDESELLVAGVSSFGYAGTIAHVVVRQAPEMCRRRDIMSGGASASSVFPNRVKLAWMMPPHPLLQQVETLGIASRGVEYMTVFHEKLMNLYNKYIIGGRCLFPGAGFVEMGLAAGARMSQGGGGGRIAESGIELLDMSFTSPFDIEDGCTLISEHIFGRGMKFFSGDTEDDAEGDAMPFATIGEIKTGSTVSSSIEGGSDEVLRSWKDSHKEEVLSLIHI